MGDPALYCQKAIPAYTKSNTYHFLRAFQCLNAHSKIVFQQLYKNKHVIQHQNVHSIRILKKFADLLINIFRRLELQARYFTEYFRVYHHHSRLAKSHTSRDSHLKAGALTMLRIITVLQQAFYYLILPYATFSIGLYSFRCLCSVGQRKNISCVFRDKEIPI